MVTGAGSGGLTVAEERVRAAWLGGLTAELGTVNAVADGGNWGAERSVRGSVLRSLLVAIAESGAQPAELRLRGARVLGGLDLGALALAVPLVLEGVYADAPLRFNAAQLIALRLCDCHIVVDGGLAVDASHLDVRGDVDLTGTRVSGGEVELSGAQIGGNLTLDDAHISYPGGRATVNAGQTSVGQYVQCRRFRSDGRMRLSGARITGDVNLGGAVLRNDDGPALYAALIQIGADLFVSGGTRVAGGFELPGGRISGIAVFGSVDIGGAPGGMSGDDPRHVLDLEGATVEQDLVFKPEFTVAGPLLAAGVQVTGTFRFAGAAGRAGTADRAVDLRGVRADTLVLEPREEHGGIVDLSRADVRVFEDRRAGWPRRLRLRDFRYEAVDDHAAGATARERLGWLARDVDGYAPQPYEQLALAYRAAGRVEDARTVAVAGQVRRREVLGPAARVWNVIQQWTVGYGYRPWLAGLWIVGLLVVGSAVFAWQHPENLVPANPQEARPPFNPVLYAMDWLLPVVDFRQGKYWVPRGFAQIWAWISVAAGWLLGTALVAALTGMVKKE